MNFLSQLTTSEKLALLGVLVAWLVYRFDRWSERRGVLTALENELELHRIWVGNAYGVSKRGSWTNPAEMVFKLATVAVDNAIVRGPSLFLNRDLGARLVGYRQVASHMNQLIDQAIAVQSNAEVWVAHPHPELLARLLGMIEAIHLQGIGDLNPPFAAHWHFQRVVTEMNREKRSKVLPFIWAVTGVNLFFLKRWPDWL